MLVSKLKAAAAVLVLVVLVGIGATGLVASDKNNRGRFLPYQPPGMNPSVENTDLFAIWLGEQALDANGGMDKPDFRQTDPINANQLWELRKTGEDYLILPKVAGGKMALDACAGRGKPYFRETDPTNINHLWQFTKLGHYYLIQPRVAEGKLALNANEGKGNPTLSKPDVTDENYLWDLRKIDGHFMIIPLVSSKQVRKRGTDLQLEMDKDQKRFKVQEEINAIVQRAEEAGGDRDEVLDAIAKAVEKLKAKANKK